MEVAVTGGGGVTFIPYVLVEWANILVVLHLFHTYSWSRPIFWWCYIYSIRTRGMGQYFGGVTFIPYVLVEWANLSIYIHLILRYLA